eukprot:TRINITY_DN5640_c0_g1_i1.p2 TRINITY_DN5640_c0_g1~~TRINITY_DN5640_c0_g1_i1.p2  ORF type:complete len:318 (-),score=28.50 TRINITY_DN5640_c0_g1_i1:1046-1960(-)
MGNCLSISTIDGKKNNQSRGKNYQVPPDELTQAAQSPSESTLTESIVQSVGAVSDVGNQQTGRRPSSLGNSSSLMAIHEERQESFHSVYSHASFASAVSRFSEQGEQQISQTSRKKVNGRESPLRMHEGSFPRDHIPNDEMKPFWQPMSLFGVLPISSEERVGAHTFQIVGHKVCIQPENGSPEVIGSEDSVAQQLFNVSVQGAAVQESVVFRLSKTVRGLRCIKKITKGVMQCKLIEDMGDFMPGKFIYDFPESVIPKGPFSRGQYHVVTTFVDLHGDELFSCAGDFKVIKEESSIPINSNIV